MVLGLGPSSTDPARLPGGLCEWTGCVSGWRSCCLCPGTRSQAKQMRQQRTKVCSLTHHFPTFAGAAGAAQPETLLMSPGQTERARLLGLKTNTLHRPASHLSNILSRKHFFFHESTKLLWQVETRRHKTCPALTLTPKDNFYKVP